VIMAGIAPGVIDIHAHWLPRDLFQLPPEGPYGEMHDRDGQLHLGDIPLSIDTAAMSDVAAIVDDMRRIDVGSACSPRRPSHFPSMPAPTRIPTLTPSTRR
jgi:aminocarboxymuconate-semialdehyde decarboxylase